MTDEPIALTLCRATNVWPAGPLEDYEAFMDKMLSTFDDLSQNHWNQVPVDAREWAQQAIEAKLNGNPIGECPGFEDLHTVEERVPLFDPDEDEEENDDEDPTGSYVEDEEPAAEPRVARGVKGSRKKAASKGGKKKAAAPAEKKPRKVREARPLSDGKTTKIMNFVLDNPTASVTDIIDALGKQGIECTKPSTTVVRSFLIHARKVFEARGMLKHV